MVPEYWPEDLPLCFVVAILGLSVEDARSACGRKEGDEPELEAGRSDAVWTPTCADPGLTAQGWIALFCEPQALDFSVMEASTPGWALSGFCGTDGENETLTEQRLVSGDSLGPPEGRSKRGETRGCWSLGVLVQRGFWMRGKAGPAQAWGRAQGVALRGVTGQPCVGRWGEMEDQ